jgi:hypothetical protein
MGTVERIGEFKQIETTSLHHEDFPNPQQFRWVPSGSPTPPTRRSSTYSHSQARSTPTPSSAGSTCSPPPAIGFLDGNGLGGR